MIERSEITNKTLAYSIIRHSPEYNIIKMYSGDLTCHMIEK
jgi:hypothetical protein